MLRNFRSDIEIIRERDPAARGILEIFLCYPGFQSIVMHRLTHKLWLLKVPLIPRILSHLNRLFTGIEIHPGAKIGKKVFIDHGMGVVIGETAEIGNNCLLYQGVTLGGTGKSHGKRHPTLMENVVVGAGAKVLGSIIVGPNTRIGAGSVVVRNVEENSTVVGIPGRVVHQSGVKVNPLAHSALPDAEASVIKNLMDRIDQLENQVLRLNKTLRTLVKTESMDITKIGDAQNIKDKEIIEFLGDN
ncbi:Serine acetyltransferase [Prochlorococcus marinus str. MIT 9515]|uniref:Serine acetyltransferase n=1 Tax=Prochlorococcus marinus (strain MIT 9515) TaxID=167542 RepID=A2BZ23_PROM5|nr:serine O-acetyltransferase [Prochlorococcus marinus]ABM73034.1 Serine acetyltransferase [Prochlorococcus marinus str. MIT 9515]